MELETVKIACPENKRLGWKIINKDDMSDKDKLFVEKKPVAKKAKKTK